MNANTAIQLIQIRKQSSDEQRLKLEQELDQSSSVLLNLRTSYAELRQEIENLRSAHEDTFKQYLTVSQNWSSSKKQTNKLKLNIQSFKKQLVLYKNLRSHATNEVDSSSIKTFDVEGFVALGQKKIVQKIRNDFEHLYAQIYREMTANHEKEVQELQVEVEQAVHYQQIEYNERVMIQQKLESEIKIAQERLAHEKEVQINLEATYSELESEFKSIQVQKNEQPEVPLKERQSLQESIRTMVNNIKEMRQRQIVLERELIIYRHLLGKYEIKEQKVITHSSPPAQNVTTPALVTETERQGSIGIECPVDDIYICFTNHSQSKDADISGWMLKRRVDSKPELQYTLPDGIQLHPGNELRIYSKLGADATQSSSNPDYVSSSLYQKLVSNDVASWGT
ncbi:unnamed protein product [Rotaria sordida]|uniref:LTD domain-containing protein n=2 Tax=Rotaria sordida TaxID=392033 RepID=A0A814I9X8_9BILA|nr:unnamed protein product [Rotaria sordida]CAF1020061.1 unnamed protein product [Rotaria sordida]